MSRRRPAPRCASRATSRTWSSDGGRLTYDPDDVDDGRDPSDAELEPVEVPVSALSPDALRGLVTEFVTRDGTDYGVRERTVEEKVRDVLRQLERGEARIVFDPASKSANIVPSR